MAAVELFDVVAAGALAACAWGLLQWISRRLSRTPKLLWQHDDFNSAVMSRCPALRSYYKVPALLANRHVETIFAAFFRQVIAVLCPACTLLCAVYQSCSPHLIGFGTLYSAQKWKVQCQSCDWCQREGLTCFPESRQACMC